MTQGRLPYCMYNSQGADPSAQALAIGHFTATCVRLVPNDAVSPQGQRDGLGLGPSAKIRMAEGLAVDRQRR